MRLAGRLVLSVLLLVVAVRVMGQLAGVRAAEDVDSAEKLAAAVTADPNSADHHFRLGVSQRDSFATQDLKSSEQHLIRAAELNPYDWRYRLELARTRELAGSPERAEEAFLEALRLNPHSGDYRWQVANFYLRSDQPTKAATALGTAIEANPDLAFPAFDVLLRMEGGWTQIDRVWPTGRAARHRLLLLAAQREFAAGSEPPLDFLFRQWQFLRESEVQPGMAEGASLVAHLLRRGATDDSKRLWIEINELNGVRDSEYSEGTNRVWNGEFDLPPAQGALDWRFGTPDDFEVRYVSLREDGQRGLQVDFRGTRNLDFVGVTQAVVVEPGESLRLSCRMRSDRLTTDQGPLLQVLDKNYRPLLATPPVLGTSDWTTYEGAFTVPADQNLIHLRIRRRPSARIDSRIAGSLWLDSVRIMPFPAAAGAAAEGGGT